MIPTPMIKSTTEGWQQLDTRPVLVGDVYEFRYRGCHYSASPRFVEGKTDAEIIATVCIDATTFINRMLGGE